MKTQFKMGLTAAAMTLASAVLTVPGASAMVFSFETCGGTGASGPAQAACDAAYTATTLDGDVTLAAGIQNWTVPVSGLYRVTAVGAQGKSATSGFVGGRGASMAGNFTFTAGDVLQILVGHEGIHTVSPDSGNGSGGGGSFVVDSLDSPLLVAGGGGGTRAAVSQDGCDASISNFGVIGSGSGVTSSCADKAVDLGLGGIVSSASWGSGGGGFFGDGADDACCSGDGGHAWASGMTGGVASGGSGGFADGGFGGGGTGNGSWGGGGGGGYSGGDGGRVAGGGGSWNLGADQINTAGVGFGDGSVIFELLAALPEPTSTALLVLGLAGIGFTRKRRA